MGTTGTTLLLVRHGQAELGVGKSDDERKLTLEGVAELRESCAGLVRRGVHLDAVLCSPLVRARETAAILAELVAGGVEPVVLDELAPGAGAGRLVAALQGHAPGGTLCLVGHQPDLAGIVAQLVEAGTRHTCAFVPGGMACVEFPAQPALQGGRLAWICRPQDLTGGGATAR